MGLDLDPPLKKAYNLRGATRFRVAPKPKTKKARAQKDMGRQKEGEEPRIPGPLGWLRMTSNPSRDY